MASRTARLFGIVLGAVAATAAPCSAAAAPSEAPAVWVPGLAWNALAGGVPNAGGLFQAEIGFSGLPRLAYHRTLRRGFSLGGAVAFEYAGGRPSRRFDRTVVLQAPVRWTFHRSATWTAGARLEPGLQLGRERGFLVGILMGASIRAGWTVAHRFVVGAALDAPLRIAVRLDDGRPTTFDAPLLVGPVAELHITPDWALTAETLAGPYITTEELGVGLRVMAGVAYRP